MNNSILQISNKSTNCLGTGFVIDKDNEGIFVATCGHVINRCKDNILVDGKDAQLIKNTYNDGLDLAILYVSGLDIEPLCILDDTSVVSATVIGYSKLLSNPKREPINNITLKQDIELTTPSQKINIMKLHTQESISSGYSGSPVLCKTTNSVIGIVNIQEGKDTNYAICSKHLLDIYTISTEKINTIKKTKIGLTSDIDETTYSIIKNGFEKNFEKSLQSFSSQPKIWIQPRIHTIEESSNNIDDIDSKINIINIINNPSFYIIKAREQYGLTTLSHFLVKEAWCNDKPSLWLRLDANKLKPHTQEIKKYIDGRLEELNLTFDDIECIVLDEFSTSIKNADKIFGKLHAFFHDKPIITMFTITDNPLLNETVNLPEDKKFNTLYLWALPRNDIRKVVIDYNDKKFIGNENDVVDKIVADLEVLNIPRTALNCLTILKISEIGFDDSPVNRTEMLSRILSLLFNVDKIPRYKTRPDLKDTEYTLGYFCEIMIRENRYYFTRNDFLKNLNEFCTSMEIDLEIDTLFEILYQNNIITERGNEFCFKFSYWVFYFAAQRMHKDKEFEDFILIDMNYSSYPELIEFYTGIERNSNEALFILTNDIKNTCDIVEKKCGLPDKFNIYNIAQWKPSEERIKQMDEELTEGVLKSNLPDAIKDEYADKSYNPSRPLNQNIHKILEEYSLLRLMKSVQACSKALRNSDYATPEIKHNLLKEILRSWEQLSKALLVLAPILSQQGHATLDGASFVLDDYFGSTNEERFNNIIALIPTNIVDWYKDDIFSKKMTSLLYNHISNEPSEFKRHLLNLLLINKRPKKWDTHIESYIISSNKNSFYLHDVYQSLKAEYKYSFASESNLKTMEKLLKITATKHFRGIKNPSKKIIDKFDKENKYTNVIPNRDIDI